MWISCTWLTFWFTTSAALTLQLGQTLTAQVNETWTNLYSGCVTETSGFKHAHACVTRVGLYRLFHIVYYCSQMSQAKSGKPYQPIGYKFSQTSLLWLHLALSHLLSCTPIGTDANDPTQHISQSKLQRFYWAAARSALTYDLLTHYKFKLFCLCSTWIISLWNCFVSLWSFVELIQ